MSGFIARSLRHVNGLLRVNVDYVMGGLERRRVLRGRSGALPTADEVLAKAPCGFVLSTGRCGTELLTNLLGRSGDLLVAHQPTPELPYASAVVHNGGPYPMGCLRLVALAARFDHVHGAYLRGRRYIETNNRITFLAPALATLFAQSRFLHLVRHPGDFVRSGMRRGYYTPELIDHQRLVPIEGSEAHHEWHHMSRVEKIAWQWAEVNTFIESFKDSMSASRVMTMTAEDLFTDPATMSAIYEFFGACEPLSQARIREQLKIRVNEQTDNAFPRYADWDAATKAMLAKWAGVAEQYGYDVAV